MYLHGLRLRLLWLIAQVFQGVFHACLRHGLEQVPARMHAEGLDRVLLEARHKHDVHAWVLFLHRARKVQPAHPGHLDVQKRHVDGLLRSYAQGLVGIRCAKVLSLWVNLSQDSQHHVNDELSVVNRYGAHATAALPRVVRARMPSRRLRQT